MARPNWEYVRVDVRLPRHPKLDGMPGATKWKLIELWAHCGEELTDGFVREAVWRRALTQRERDTLLARGFAHPVDGGYQMHDYLDHQRSRAEVEELRKARSAAGRRGGRVKAKAKQQLEQELKQVLKQNGSKTVAEAEAEAEAEADLAVADLSNQSNGGKPRGYDRDSINQLIIAEINTITGRVVSPEWAAKIANHILAGKTPADPAAYIRQAMRNEPNPRTRFLPVY